MSDAVASPASSEATVPRADDPAEQLQALWHQGQSPDVDEFLARAGCLAPGQVAAVLRVDQRQRWHAGQEMPAEDYLQKHPQVLADAEAAVDLIYNEYLLREKKGEVPGLDAFLKRFPAQAATLRCQINLHLALARSPEGDVTSAGLSGKEQGVPGPGQK